MQASLDPQRRRQRRGPEEPSNGYCSGWVEPGDRREGPTPSRADLLCNWPPSPEFQPIPDAFGGASQWAAALPPLAGERRPGLMSVATERGSGVQAVHLSIWSPHILLEGREQPQGLAVACGTGAPPGASPLVVPFVKSAGSPGCSPTSL